MERLYAYIEQARAALETGIVQPNSSLDNLPHEYSHLKLHIIPSFSNQIERVKDLPEYLSRFHISCLTIQENLEMACAVRNGLEMKAARLSSPIHPLFRLSVPQENLISAAKKSRRKG